MTSPDTAPNIVALGGMNMALIGTAKRLPLPGETLRGERFYTAPGGKGATQAVAAARLGANVKMVGRVGRDLFGPTLLDALKKDGIDVTGVAEDPDHPSGVGVIILDAERQNHVLAIYGANLQCNEDQLAAVETALDGADVLLLQMEIPFRLSMAAARAARARGVTTMLDPAPASDIPPDAFRDLDIVTSEPDRGGVPHRHTSRRHPVRPGGCRSAIGTGSEDSDRENGRARSVLEPPRKVAATCRPTMWTWSIPSQRAMRSAAALAVALAEGRSIQEAIRYASAAGALAVTKRGVQTAMPSRAEVDALYQYA